MKIARRRMCAIYELCRAMHSVFFFSFRFVTWQCVQNTHYLHFNTVGVLFPPNISIPYHGSVLYSTCFCVIDVFEIAINDAKENHGLVLPRAFQEIGTEKERRRHWWISPHFISTVSEIRFYDKLMKHPLQHRTNIAISIVQTMLWEKCSFDNNHTTKICSSSYLCLLVGSQQMISNEDFWIVSWLSCACTTRYCFQR